MKTKYYCKKCNKETTKYSKTGFCGSCWAKQRFSIPKNNPMYGNLGDKHPNWKGNKAKCRQIYYCKFGCGAKVFKEGNGCGSCSTKISHRNFPHNIKNCQCAACKTKRGECKGINNPNFKGWITKLSQLIRNSDEYKFWRTSVFQRDNYTCQECYKLSDGDLEAHHIKQFNKILNEFLKTYSQFSPIEEKEILLRLTTSYEPFWNISNGVTLCEKCHNKIKIVFEVKGEINNEQ